MFITIFSSISAALCVYCILSRVNKRAVELAVRLAVRDIEKEFEIERAQLLAQLESKLGAKESELKKARQVAQLHEVVPSIASLAKPKAAAGAAPAKPPEEAAGGRAARVRDVAPVHGHLVRRAARGVERRQDRAGRLVARRAPRGPAIFRATAVRTAPRRCPMRCGARPPAAGRRASAAPRCISAS